MIIFKTTQVKTWSYHMYRISYHPSAVLNILETPQRQQEEHLSAIDPNGSHAVAQRPEDGPSVLTRVGAILLLFCVVVLSSFSDSLAALASLLPRILPLTELVALWVYPDMGVCGGVVVGKPTEAELVAATLGTLPNVGVGLVMMIPLAVCNCEDCVAMDEAELDRVGLGGRPTGMRDGEGANPDDEACLIDDEAVTVVGVGTGVVAAEDIEDVASNGWCSVGT